MRGSEPAGRRLRPVPKRAGSRRRRGLPRGGAGSPGRARRSASPSGDPEVDEPGGTPNPPVGAASGADGDPPRAARTAPRKLTNRGGVTPNPPAFVNAAGPREGVREEPSAIHGVCPSGRAARSAGVDPGVDEPGGGYAQPPRVRQRGERAGGRARGGVSDSRPARRAFAPVATHSAQSGDRTRISRPRDRSSVAPRRRSGRRLRGERRRSPGERRESRPARRAFAPVATRSARSGDRTRISRPRDRSCVAPPRRSGRRLRAERRRSTGERRESRPPDERCRLSRPIPLEAAT